MNTNSIEEAAEKYASVNNGERNQYTEPEYSHTVRDFKAGAEWQQSQPVLDKEQPNQIEVMLKLITDFAGWSIKYPRGGIYSTGSKMDEELIALEERAKILIPTPKNSNHVEV